VDTAALSLALTAGALAALNPCGFALLPAYLSMFVVPGDSGGPLRSTGRALMATAAMTAGFVAVFAVFGLAVSPFAAASQRFLPYVTAATGVLLALVGLVLLAGGRVSVPMPRFVGFDGRGPRAAFGYGIVYALASLTCTVAPFLAIVVTSLRSGDRGEGVALFVAYAAGMGAVVGVAAVAVALASGGLVGHLRSAGRWVPRLVGVLVLVVGAYVAWYGVWEIRVLDGADPADPVVDTALEIQRWLNDLVRPVLPSG
jgi:cytochrome c-type biogenesis protein